MKTTLRTLRAWPRALAVVVLAISVATPRAAAIDIVIQLDDDGQNPGFDPNGTRLEALFFEAEAIWEALLPDPGTYEIDVWWGNLDDGTLAVHENTGTGADNNIIVDPTPRREDATDLGFFIDATPWHHGEFDFITKAADPNCTCLGNSQGMTLFSDLGDPFPAKTWFPGPTDAPDMLEVGYIGKGDGTLLGESNNIPGGTMNTDLVVDLLSVLLHEIGHDLGINSSDLEDGWEIDPQHINGIGTIKIEETLDDDGAHLQVDKALMWKSTPNNQRRLPTATDVLAIAWDEEFDNVNLARRHLIGNGIWGTNSNWVGNKKPDSSSSAYILNGLTSSMTANADARNLTLDDGGQLFVNSNDLSVVTETRIGNNSTLLIGPGGEAHLNRVFITGTGTITLNGGMLFIEDLDNDAPSGIGGISGHGFIGIGDSMGVDKLVNNGKIAPTGGLLQIAGPGPMDLDGDETDGQTNDGVVDLFAGDLETGPGLTDNFDGVMIIGPNHYAAMSFFSLGESGKMFFSGDPGDPATMTGRNPGDTHGFRGDIVVDADGIISTDLAIMHPTLVADMPDVGDKLFLNSPNTRILPGAQFTGDGSLVQGGDLSFQDTGDITIEVQTFDWGGDDPFNPNELRVEMETTLIVDSLGSGEAGNPFKGEMVLAGGKIEVNMPGGWSLPGAEAPNEDVTLGILRMFSSEGSSARVRGEHLTVGGFIEVQGGLNFMDADMTMLELSALQLTQLDSELRLNNTTTLDGGQIFGQGTLLQIGDIHVTSYSFMDAATFDWGNGKTRPLFSQNPVLTIDPGATLDINSASLGESDNEYRGVMNINGGILDVSNANGIVSWALPALVQNGANDFEHEGVLNLNQPGADVPTLTGAALHVFGRVNIDADRAETHNIVFLWNGSRTEFQSDGEWVTGFRTSFLGGVIDHNNHEAVMANLGTAMGLTNGIHWANGDSLTVQGNPGGSLTFDLTADAYVEVSNGTQTLTIDPGATVIAAGDRDPFTNSHSMGIRHVDIVNNSTNSFIIENGLAAEVVAVNGMGNTRVLGASSLTADAVVQNLVEVGVGSSLFIRQADSEITTTEGVLNGGHIESTGGDLIVSGPVQHHGTFHTGGGNELVFEGLVTGPGAFNGPGTVVLNGGYEPGASPAITLFEGSVVFGPSNVLSVELGGLDPGTGYDRVTTFGVMVLDGTLELSILPPFDTDIVPGDNFVPLVALVGFGGGQFDAVTYTPPTGLEGLMLELTYFSKAVHVDAHGLPGDANLDGTVDLTDLTILAINFETPFETRRWRKADFNFDGLTDLSDLTILAINFGATVSNGAMVPGSGADVATLAAAVGLNLNSVPEPATVCVVLLGAVAAGRRRRGFTRIQSPSMIRA